MNHTGEEIEKVLRTAPKPVPPANLKKQLVDAVRLPAAAGPSLRTVVVADNSSWWKRWWPVLLPAAASAACGVAFTLQQIELDVLRQSLRQLPAESTSSSVVTTSQGSMSRPAPGITVAVSPEEELATLQESVAKLSAEVQALEKVQLENNQLRARASEAVAGTFAPEELQALSQANETAMRIHCINNLKQLGLAARVWAVDNGDLTPPSLLAMTNEMGSPKILVCPADTGREVAKDWGSVTPANTSYSYLLPSTEQTEPEAVLFMCPIHGSIGLMDGSVQSSVAKEKPQALQQRNGKLIFSNDSPAGAGAAPQSQPGPQP